MIRENTEASQEIKNISKTFIVVDAHHYIFQTHNMYTYN